MPDRMQWPKTEALAKFFEPGTNVKFGQLTEPEIPTLIKSLSEWFPDIKTGAESVHLQRSFYLKNYYLKGGAERDLYPFVLRREKKLVGFFSLKRDVAAGSITGRLGVIAPDLRAKGLMRAVCSLSTRCAELMGAEVIYFHATLRHPYTQQAYESQGFKIVGIIPAFDRDLLPSGRAVRAPEAIYCKVLCPPSECLDERDLAMTEEARTLWDFLFKRPKKAE